VVDSGPKAAVEQGLKTISDITLKIYGGIKENHQKYALHASKQALVKILQSYSGLLQKQVPTENDIVVDIAPENARRLRENWRNTVDSLHVTDYATGGFRGRRLQSTTCSDDTTAFKTEASKVNVFENSCLELLVSLGNDVDAMCAEASLQQAMAVGCQKTCKLCAELTTSTTTTTTMAPDLQEGAAISFAFVITTHTDFSATNVLGRLELLKEDPIAYVQMLFVEMEAAFEGASIPLDEIPSRLWVKVVAGPTQTVIGGWYVWTKVGVGYLAANFLSAEYGNPEVGDTVTIAQRKKAEASNRWTDFILLDCVAVKQAKE
jgi:hypothetical protein